MRGTLLNPLGLIFIDCARESHCGCYERGTSACSYCHKEPPLDLLRADLIVSALELAEYGLDRLNATKPFVA